MRFFVDTDLSAHKTLTLPDDVYHHWCKVLRANVGDGAILFNGQGGEYDATLTHLDKKSALVHITNFNPINRTPPYRLTLIQAMSKGERMDYTIQKATELGVHQIQLITTKRSERLRYERDHKKIAISACEQCGLNIVPKVLAPIAQSDCLSACTDDLKIVLSPPTNERFMPKAPLPRHISVLVGAEGGLSDDEISLCHRHGFVSWAVGERVLRTETAGVVALAGLQVIADGADGK